MQMMPYALSGRGFCLGTKVIKLGSLKAGYTYTESVARHIYPLGFCSERSWQKYNFEQEIIEGDEEGAPAFRISVITDGSVHQVNHSALCWLSKQ